MRKDSNTRLIRLEWKSIKKQMNNQRKKIIEHCTYRNLSKSMVNNGDNLQTQKTYNGIKDIESCFE